ncbi:cobaltochelatase subunit CobN [Capilliphycus salinus ALCB114379]|uniref:cobaltochelatase subunit CobN n=1 Tax=Capilliphycus salinus TaxID=2768948 RepID=UPI0039A43737
MHRISATPGGWTPDTEGVIFIEQTPAPIIFLTAADTDIQTLASAIDQLPTDFPSLRVANLLQLQQQLTIDTYAEDILSQAKVIIIRLLGGRSYWNYGLEVVEETVEKTGAKLIILPGDDRPDPDLMSHSTVSLKTVNQLWHYFTEGGIENYKNALLFLANICLDKHYNYQQPVSVPRVGIYQNDFKNNSQTKTVTKTDNPQVGILFYRAHYLSGNLRPIDALCQALREINLNPIPVFVSSLRDPDVQAEVITELQKNSNNRIEILLNTTSFSIASISEDSTVNSPLFSLDIPILQVIFSSQTVQQWETDFQGLSPRDVAMNVALPEVDGRIITRAVSFKAVETWNSQLETDVIGYIPVGDRIKFVADLAANWVKLRRKKATEKRIAIVLANYPTADGRLANGVGLDTPASCVHILEALQQQGYNIQNVPKTGEELIQRLTSGITNDPEGRELRTVQQSLNWEDFQQYFSQLPDTIQTAICQRWKVNFDDSSYPEIFPISGIQLNNIFVGIQPSRGYDRDPSLNYHAPDLEPTPDYLAFYYWLRYQFQADAIVHVGKHGNLEWLPGKSVGLSQNCYPEIAFGAIPHLYPFIVNDPGEGSQAKRRSQAVILDHLTPPLTRAELYGSLQQLEGIVDEYYEAQSLDPSRLPMIKNRLQDLIKTENLNQDLGLAENKLDAQTLNTIDGYLCELKEAQIRDGLHIFGQCPTGKQLRDLIVSIARHPSTQRLGITRAIAEDWQLEFDPLTTDLSEVFSQSLTLDNQICRTVGDAVEVIENHAASLVEKIIAGETVKTGQLTQKELQWIENKLLPNLQKTHQEITHLLKGLEGRYIPSGSSGAPTRGRPDVLPTGRNFYSVDIRAIPTETAWRVGQLAADALIERYTQENGEYPRTLGLSVWGTSTMRTGGDDIAEALALLGVQPVWDGPSRRVVDFEILPISILGRPRVDVTLRISGFFRDAFPNLIDLFDQAVVAVSQLDEPPELNPLAAQVKQETEVLMKSGLTKEQAEMRSRYRVFGSKPGAYGAGLQGLIASQNWTDEQDLARAYINWSSYAYTSQTHGMSQSKLGGISAPEAFKNRLQQMQIVLHNQDNREHDILDSDDYYQFQGGLTASVRAITGKNPKTYFGDNAQPERPKVRQLKQEIARVYRSRVINPKWIAGVMRHGYKGAFEMAATVDYLFAYDATANCVEDFMYEGVAKAYLLDETVQKFIQEKNPWALRDMAERLLEANQRGLWKASNQKILEDLRTIVHEAEGAVEAVNSQK